MCLSQEEEVVIRISINQLPMMTGEDFMISTFIKNNTNQSILVYKKAFSTLFYNKNDHLYRWGAGKQYEVLIDLSPSKDEYLVLEPLQEIEIKREKYLYRKNHEGFGVYQTKLWHIKLASEKFIFIRSEYNVFEVDVQYAKKMRELPSLYQKNLVSNVLTINLECE